MTKKKLYFDATPLINKYVSGVGKVLLETLRALDTEYYRDKYDIYMFVPLDERSKLNKYTFTYIRTKTLPYPHKFLSLFSRLRFAPPLDLFLGKGIYIFENYRNWNLAFSKSITYVHDAAFAMFPEYIEARNLQYLRKHIRLWIGRTDKVVTIAETAKVDLERELSLGSLDVVVNAADDNMYPRTQGEIDAAREKWKIPEHYYVYLGNIEPRKNLVNTVNGFAKYVKDTSMTDTLVLIGGDGWKNEEIYEAIDRAKADGVKVMRPDGYVPDDDLPALLSGAEAVLQLSWHEGFGMSVLHALACGTPVVAADIPVLHEAARDNDDHVIYVNPGDVVAIAQAIKEAKRMPHTKEPRHITRWSQTITSLEAIIDSL